MISIDCKQPHNLPVVFFAHLQGCDRMRQRVGFLGGPTFVVGSPHIHFVPPFRMSDKSDSNKPVKTFRLRGSAASIFENRSDDGKSTVCKVTRQRSYKQGDDWKTTSSFGRDDLPIVSLLTKQAWEFILNTESSGQKEDK